MAALKAPSERLAGYDLQYIDKGAFGSVFKAIRRTDGREFALKQVDLSKLTKRMDLAMAMDEAHMLARLNHPHVVRYYDSFVDSDNRLNILMEYASKGTVKKLLDPHRPLPEDLVWRILIQSTLGLQYLHSNKIIHRDIKAANLFIDANNNIKIGDLGIARALSASSNLAHTQIGTPYYLAPELCEDKPYNVKSDVWSLGVVLYECCMGCYPFDVDNNNTVALMRKIIRGQFKPVQGNYSAALIQAVTSCLTFKPEARPDTSAILRNPALIAKAKALNIDLNPRPSASTDQRAPPPAPVAPPSPGPGPYGSPNYAAPGPPAPGGPYASPQQPPYSPYQQPQSPYSPYQQPNAAGAYPGRSPGGGQPPAAHPFALGGPIQAWGPQPQGSPYSPQQGAFSPPPPQHPYQQGAPPARPAPSPSAAPYAVYPQGQQGPGGEWDRLAVDVNRMQLREGEVARNNAERQQQAQANMHAGQQDHAKGVIYGGPQDSGPRPPRVAPEALPAAGRRPSSAHAGGVAAPFATHYAAGGSPQTQAHASMQEAWTATYQPPQYGRRRNPELQITGPSLRSSTPRGNSGGARGGYVPAADDATTYVSSTTYYTGNR